MNQYTTTPKDSRTYDANGNLLTAVTSAGTRSYTYDYRNMMVGFEDEGGIVSEYRYDALGRRIEKVVDAEGTPVTTRYLHNSRWQVIEERSGSNAVQATYLHGAWIDETIQMKRGTTASYYLQDDLFSTLGVVDHTGALVETVEYADYGEPLIRNATGVAVSHSTVSNARLFTGREWDAESRLYNYRTRYMDSETGRFNTRDGIGTWGDQFNRGSASAYAGNSPVSRLDPNGRASRNWSGGSECGDSYSRPKTCNERLSRAQSDDRISRLIGVISSAYGGKCGVPKIACGDCVDRNGKEQTNFGGKFDPPGTITMCSSHWKGESTNDRFEDVLLKELTHMYDYCLYSQGHPLFPAPTGPSGGCGNIICTEARGYYHSGLCDMPSAGVDKVQCVKDRVRMSTRTHALCSKLSEEEYNALLNAKVASCASMIIPHFPVP